MLVGRLTEGHHRPGGPRISALRRKTSRYDRRVRVLGSDLAGRPYAVRVGLGLLLLGSLLVPDDALARSKKKPKETTPEQPTTAGGMPSPLVDPMEAEHSAPPSTGTPPAGGGTQGGTQPPVSGGSGSSSSGGGGGGGSSGGTSSGGSAHSGGAEQPSGGENGQFNKAGRFMANLKIGPAICAYTCPSHEGALVVDIGWSVLPNKNAYVIIPLQFQFSTTTAAVIAPFGFQYDLAISRVPGLYIYPRLSLGYAALLDSSTGVTTTTHAGILLPELGAKFILRGRFNFGGEFFSLPVIFGRGPFGGFVDVFYRILVYAGINF